MGRVNDMVRVSVRVTIGLDFGLGLMFFFCTF